MATFSIFSKRNKKKNFDVYRYENIPIELRRQIILIWIDAIGVYYQPGMYEMSSSSSPANRIWNQVVKILSKEYGTFGLTNSEYDNSFEQCQKFIQNCTDEQVIDITEITFKAIDRIIRDQNQYTNEQSGIKQEPDDAIEELNARFKEHGLGYQYVDGNIIRVDSEFLHQEAILPAIHLLHNEKFKGAEDEFFKAHEHYRHKRNKEAINECLKSFESCLKEICHRKKWSFPPKATSSALIDLVIKNGLIPQELLAHFTGLRSTLESGVPTIRNSNAGHGQGKNPVKVPEYLVSYALNITASALLLLVNSFKESK